MTSRVAPGPAASSSAAGPRGKESPGEAARLSAQRPRPAAELFSRLLRRGGLPEGERAGEAAQAAQLGAAAMMASWFRAESSAPAVTDGRRVAAGAAPTIASPRVLIGGGSDSPEARIQISAGPCAGAEIRLRAGASGVIEAELLTPTASSRQTLAVAMDEVGLRLRARGIHLRGASGSPGQGQGQGRQRDSERQQAQDDLLSSDG